RKRKFLQELCEHISVNDVHQPAQVVSYKHKSCISACMFYSFFSNDIIKSPLSFYRSIRMFCYTLTFFIYLWVGLNILFVYFYIGSILTSFYHSSFQIFGAQLSYTTADTGIGFIVLNNIMISVFTFLIPVPICR